MDVTKNTVRNARWGLISQALQLFFPFIVRTIIIRTMGEQYIGLSGLFTSILNLMNIAELGFNSAIVFSMYSPIAKKDDEAICALLSYYRKIYRAIGIIVTVIGFAITPFLDVMIKGTYPADINLYALYFIYLANTALGYFLFAYKAALLTAYHRNDLINKNAIIVNIVQHVVQILVLIAFREYHIYLIMLPIATILTNIFNHFSAKHYFPAYVCKGSVSAEYKAIIKKQVKGIMVSKICNMLRNSLANIIISSFMGLTAVATYGNYYYIMTAVHGVLTILGVSMKAGVGINLIKENKADNYKTFKKLTFMYMWLGSWFTVCLACLYQPFMLLWTGKPELCFDSFTMFLFASYFFILCLQDIRNVFADAAGLYWEIRYRALLESIATLVLTFILGYFFGVAGVVLATLITYVTINLTYGTKILFRHYFSEERCILYLGSLAKYTVITAVIATLCYLLCMLLPFTGIPHLLLRGVVCAIVPNILLVVAYIKDSQFLSAKQFVLHRLLKK